MVLLFNQGLEAKLQDPKKNYQEKVNALLSAWERLAHLITSSQDAQEHLAECIRRYAIQCRGLHFVGSKPIP
jgi:hypothetical protein